MCSVFRSLTLSCSIGEYNLVVTEARFLHDCKAFMFEIFNCASSELWNLEDKHFQDILWSLKVSCGGQQQVHTVSEILHNKKPPMVY